MKNEIKSKDINAFNVYQVRNRTYYYCDLTKITYIIDNDSAGRFQFYSTRHSLAILLCFILMNTSKNYGLCFLISAFAYLIISFLFYKVYLNKLQEVSFTVEDDFLTRLAQSQKKSNLLLILFCLLLSTVTIFANTIQDKAIGLTIINYIVGVIFALGSIFTTLLLIKNKKK